MGSSVLRNTIWLSVAVALLGLSACSASKKQASRASKHERRSTPSLTHAEPLENFVREWEGVPYKYGGTTKQGVDCSGFVGVLYNEVYRTQVPRTTGELSAQSKTIPKHGLKEGDLVFFDINGKKTSHVGVYMNAGKFVHASTSKGVIVSDLENPYYQKTFSKAGRL